MLQHVLQCVPLLQERRCGLIADSGHAGDVVRGVSDQRFPVRDTLWTNAVALPHRLRIVHFDFRDAAHRHLHRDAIPDQLQLIRVTRKDRDGVAFTRALRRQRPDQVIRLVAAHLRRLDGERRYHLPRHRHLRLQLGIHFRPMRFVRRELLGAQRLLRRVPTDHDRVRLLVTQQRKQHIRESVQCAGRSVVGSGEVASREVRAEKQAVRIYKNELLGQKGGGGIIHKDSRLPDPSSVPKREIHATNSPSRCKREEIRVVFIMARLQSGK